MSQHSHANIFSRCVIDNLELDVLRKIRFKIIEGDGLFYLGIVQPPVAIFFNKSHNHIIVQCTIKVPKKDAMILPASPSAAAGSTAAAAETPETSASEAAPAEAPQTAPGAHHAAEH